MSKWSRMDIIHVTAVVTLGVALGVIVCLFYFKNSFINSLVFGSVAGTFIFAPLVALLIIWISNLYDELWRDRIGPRVFVQLRTSGYHERRGQSYWIRGDYDRAIAEFNTSFDLAGGRVNMLFFFQRGMSYYENGEYDLAIADLDKYIHFSELDLPVIIGNRDPLYTRAKGVRSAAVATRREKNRSGDNESR